MEKILVANRGEIAVRIIRTCKKMGISTVAVYPEMDAKSLHVSMADEAVLLQERRDYLNQELLIQIAREKGCQGIHPGYGFLAENPDFVEHCHQEGLCFLGPSSQAIASMGMKIRSREIMESAGVPIVPGSSFIADIHEGLTTAQELGYPVMLKASAGGGGRGIRVAHNPEELKEEFPAAQKEARIAFGNDAIYFEKFFTKPRHIEIQVLADNHGHVIHIGERECSIQRRRQKLLEEAPSPFVNEELREEMGAAAVRAAQAVDYSGCGTVEFLVNENGQYYFLEMNTRIQVEHPVTEMVTGLDLIEEQIRVGFGEPLSLKQEDITLGGWSVECRINAEDPSRGFRPSPGLITRFSPPLGPFTRMDTFLTEGFKVTPLFDSLIGKVIVWGRDRTEALARMRLALDEMVLEGVHSTASILRLLLDNGDFVKGKFSNRFLEDWLAEKDVQGE